MIYSFCLLAFTIVTISNIYDKYIVIIGGFIVMIFFAAGLYFSQINQKLTIKEKMNKLINKVEDEIIVLEEMINKEEEKKELRYLKEKIVKRERLIAPIKK